MSLWFLKDICNLSDQSIDEWKFQYRKDHNENDINSENIAKIVPITPDLYIAKYGDGDDDEIESMQESARVPMRIKAPVNDFTDRLRVAAGLK